MTPLYLLRIVFPKFDPLTVTGMALKVHKNENFFGFDFEFCTILMLVMYK
jgi:hypothetical protein